VYVRLFPSSCAVSTLAYKFHKDIQRFRSDPSVNLCSLASSKKCAVARLSMEEGVRSRNCAASAAIESFLEHSVVVIMSNELSPDLMMCHVCFHPPSTHLLQGSAGQGVRIGCLPASGLGFLLHPVQAAT